MSERILITQPYGIGDTIFMLPFLRAIREQLPVERLDVILGSRTRLLLENSHLVDKIYVIDKDKWKAQKIWRPFIEKSSLLFTFLRRRYTIFVDLSMQPEYAFWAKYALHVRVRAGFNYKKRNRFLNRPLPIPDAGFQGKHMIEYYDELAHLLGVAIRHQRPELSIPPGFQARAESLLAGNGLKPGSYLVVAPGGGATWGQDAHLKHWPLENFASLIVHLKERVAFDGVAVLGIASESSLGDGLQQRLTIPVVNFCGATDLLVATAIIRMSRIFLGNDGGLVHLAATQGTPIIAFYGPADPNVYGAYPPGGSVARIAKGLPCQPCYKQFRYNSACSGFACLKTLSPQDVLNQLTSSDFFAFFNR